MDEEDLRDALRRRGIELEPREPTAIENLVGSGLGSLGGQLVAKAMRCGWLGTGLAGVAGGALGLLAMKYRIRLRRSDRAEPGVADGHVYY